ncbi:bifunctional 4-hydroxy-2-oxoglutarate aldolase/2-dehydro-3-deoxy-phosphogluconate aldolase [Rhodococcus koreensis]
MTATLDTDILRSDGCVAILRASTTDHFPATVRTLVEADLRIMEISLTTPGALASIRQLVDTLPTDVYLGAGTVTTVDAARAAADAGAQYLVTPNTSVPVIEYAHAVGLPILVGALTPTEIFTAWEAGATAVKVFPASVGGPEYCRALTSGPYPDIPLVPTGGVDLSDAHAYLQAGAVALGMAGSLLGSAPEGGSQAELAARIREFRTATARRGEQPVASR